jgi:hypothetical protein
MGREVDVVRFTTAIVPALLEANGLYSRRTCNGKFRGRCRSSVKLTALKLRDSEAILNFIIAKMFGILANRRLISQT